MNDDTIWCRNLFASLHDYGMWGVPRSGLFFQKHGDKLVLVSRAPHPSEAYQRDDFETIKRQFDLAGITVESDEGVWE